ARITWLMNAPLPAGSPRLGRQLQSHAGRQGFLPGRVALGRQFAFARKPLAALPDRCNRGYDALMVESLAHLRARAWPLVIGMIAGGAVVVFAGAGLFWGLVALSLAAMLIVQFVSFQEPIL